MPDQKPDQGTCGHQGGHKGTVLRFSPDQQHNRQAQDSAGQAVQNGSQGTEQESGKHNLCQHQQNTAFNIHQVYCIQQYRIGKAQLDSWHKSAEKSRYRHSPVQQAQHQRKRRQQSETRNLLRSAVQSLSSLSDLWFHNYIFFAPFRQGNLFDKPCNFFSESGKNGIVSD